MKIANQFTVSAPIEQAWDVLCDLEQVIPLSALTVSLPTRPEAVHEIAGAMPP